MGQFHMYVSAVGVNHSTSPVRFREKLAISNEALSESLNLLRQYVSNGIILSTCNRTEVYAMDNQPAEEASINFLNTVTRVSFTDLLPHIYLRKNETAFQHLFSIASGLNSMIIGEFEILGQVGQALKAAEKMSMVNLPLRSIFQSAIRTGRRVREETGISKNALSASSIALDLASKVVGDLSKCKMLVIGTGEAGRLVIKVAKDRGTSQIVVASRTMERASTLAKTIGGIPISMDKLQEELTTCNIVVGCAGAPHPILSVNYVSEVMRKRQALPLAIIDIAVPRNVEPGVEKINNVFLYNIDDLTQITDLHREQRKTEIESALAIIADEVNMFASWWRALDVRPVVSALMEKAEDIRSAQLKKTLKKLPSLSDKERKSLEAMTRSIVTKILKDPVQHLKVNSNYNPDYTDIVSRLFRLDRGKE